MERFQLVTIGEVKKLTGLHPDTIRKYEKNGQFPKARKIGARKYWHIDTVKDWIAKFKN